MSELQQSFYLHATERNQIWRILLGMLLIFIVYFALIFGMTSLLVYKGIDLTRSCCRDPQGLAVMLLSFFPVWVGVQQSSIVSCTDGAFRRYMDQVTRSIGSIF